MKKIKFIFIAFYLLLFAFLAFAHFSNLITPELRLAVLVAAILNIFSLLGSMLAFRLSIRKSDKIFILFNLGGMSVKLFVLLAVILLVLKFLKIDVYGFILLFFIFYFAQLIAEIYYFNNFLKRK